MHTIYKTALILSSFAFAASLASAQPTADPTPGKTDEPTPASATGDEALPAPQSDHDEQPMVASPGMTASGGLVSQAGVGGLIGYGRAGVLELGGSAGFTFASDYTQVQLAPTIGWFLADNFEMSAILAVNYIKAGDSSSTFWTALLEPSYHVPFNRSTFGFIGLGTGASHVSGLGTGFAVAPRLGANIMVGRSGVLTPSLAYQYTTLSTDVEVAPGETDVTVVALTGAVRFNVGYTVMW